MRSGACACARARVRACWQRRLSARLTLLPLSPTLPAGRPLLLRAAAGSREGKLLTDLIKAFQEQNGDAFADALYNYNQISALDNWKVGVLKVAKEHLTGPGGGEGGGGGGDDASLM